MQQPKHQCVALSLDGRIARVRLNRPDKLNAVSLDLLDDLIEAAALVRAQPDVRVVLIEGDQRAFSAGLDFPSAGREPTRMKRYLTKILRPDNRFQRCCMVWRDLPIPVIAVIQGHCYGAGMQIAMAADFRIAEPSAKLAIMEAKWGLVPDMSGLVTFPDCLPMDQAKLLTMTAEPVDGNTALRHGLVTAVSDTPTELALAWAERLLERSPDALALTKRLFHRTWNSGPRWSMLWETLYQLRLLSGRNHRISRKRGAGEDIEFEPRSVR